MGEQGQLLETKLAGVRQWWRLTRLLSGVGWTLCLVLVLGLLCYHADRTWTLTALAREKWRLGILVAGVGSLLAFALHTFLRRLPDNALAAAVERRYPILRERLLAALDLSPRLAHAVTSGGSLATLSFSPTLAAELIAETRREADPLDFRRAVNLKPLQTSLLALCFVVLLTLLQAAFAPQAFATWLQRMANPYADIAPFAATRITLTPAASVLPRGESLTVKANLEGKSPADCTLRYRLDSEKEDTWHTLVNTAPQSTSTFRLPALAQSITLYATAGDGRSDTKRVLVEDRPAILNMRMTFHYPAYLKQPPQTLPETTGNISVPVGTEVQVEAIANKPLQEVECQTPQNANVAWQVEGNKATGRLTIARNGFFALHLTDQRGFQSQNPPRHEIRALVDGAPNVQITRPATDMDLVPNGSLPLVATASDDHGVASLGLHYDRLQPDPLRGTTDEANARKVGQGNLPMEGATGAPQANAAVRWHIGVTQAKPGETLRYAVQARDTDTVRGPHVGVSQTYRVRVVSLTEMQQRLKAQLDEESRQLAQLRQRQIAAQRELQQARQKQDPAAINRAQTSQRSLADETRAATERVRQTSNQLENNNLATKSEIERRDRASQTLDTLAQRKMPAAADTMQQPSQLGQAERQQEAIKRDIEQAQRLLSRTLSPEQLAQEAERLAAEQQRLADASRSLAEDIKAEQQKGNKNLSPEMREGLATERRQQAQVNADTQQMQRQLESAAKAAAERGEKQEASALQKAAQALQKSNVGREQQSAQNNLQKNSPSQAAPSQDKAAEALKRAAQQAQKANPNAPEAPQTAAERLEQAAEQLRDIAEKQRDLADKTAKNPNAAQSQSLAQQQRALQQQANAAQQQMRDSQQAQQSLNSAQQNMSQSQQQLQQNRPQSAKQPAQKAADQLEKAAEQANNAAMQMRQQQMAGEMAERVERLARVQRGLQNATERLNSSQQKGSLNENQRHELGQIGGRQEQLEREARNLAQRLPSAAFQQALRMASRQMRPASQALKQSQPDTGTETQSAQNRAAQTLETVAQSLKQQAQNGPPPGQMQNGQQQPGSAQQAQQAAALGELMLAQGLQQQVRQETGTLDKARFKNPNQALNQAQRRAANQLTQGQRETGEITQRAGESLEQLPGMKPLLQEATQQMGQAEQRLSQQQTGQPTQSHQDNALRSLDRAVQQAQQQMQQQQQQQQAQQQAQQGAPRPNPQPGNLPPDKAMTRLMGVNRGNLAASGQLPGKGFTSLSNRAQRTLREGQQERVPAEFQDWVNRYYKSLAERKP